MSQSYFLSIVIPAYNEENNIETMIRKVKSIIQDIETVSDYEIIVVDDHSPDQTYHLVEKLALSDEHLKCLRLSRRNGSHTALRAGIEKASGEIILCISADGQDDPAAIGEMITKISEGNQIVWALRRARQEGLLAKVFAKAAYKIITWFITSENSHIDLAHADFFMFSRQFADAIQRCPERNTSLFGLMIWLGYKQDVVYYDRQQRLSGSSKWSFRARFRLLTDWIIAFSGIPLKMISFVGFLTATVGFFYAIFVMFYALFGYAKPGWSETVILILVLGGLQMLMLGITGEYLWRNLDETRKRPLFFVEKSTGELKPVEKEIR